MRDSRAFVLDKNKADEFLRQKTDKKAMERIYRNADKFEKNNTKVLEYYQSGNCMNDCEHYDNCSNYIYSKGYNKAIDDVFNFLKNHRDKKYMKVNLDDLDIRKYKEQLQS